MKADKEEKILPEISRRTFLKGSAASAISLASLALLGGSVAHAETEASPSEEASWLGEEPVISESDIAEEKDVDVVVIGAGVAGVSAARAAAENGAKVALFEKADAPQGRGEDYAVINGKLQERFGKEHLDPDDVVDRLMQDFLYRSKRPILKRWAEECADAFDWFIASKEDLYIGDTTLADIPDEHKDQGSFAIKTNKIHEPDRSSYRCQQPELL